MRKNNISLSIVLTILLISCGTNEPAGPYTSIKGTWRCTETSVMNSRSYSVDIYRTKKDTSVYLLSNFYNVSIEGEYDITAKLSGNTLTINPSPQSIGPTAIVVKSGSAVVNENFTQMVFDYIIYDGQSDIKVHSVYSR